MSKTSTLFLDKGSDFDAHVQICGINNQPIDISNFAFACQMRLIRNPKIKLDVECNVIKPCCGYLNIHIPFYNTQRIPAGDYMYDIQMTYKNRPCGQNRRLKVLGGRIVVTDQVTTCACWC